MQQLWRRAVGRFRPTTNIPPVSFVRLKDISQSTNWSHHHEWVLEDALQRRAQTSGRSIRFVRVLALLWPKIRDMTNLVIFTTTGVVVITIGIVEAYMLSNPGQRDAEFLFWYSFQQMLPSNVWERKDPDIVCLALGRDPKKQLRTFGDNMEDARTQLLIHDVNTLRAVTAGYMFMAQILRLVNHTLAAGKIFRELVIFGREPPLRNRIRGRVIRLCGKRSLLTQLTVKRCGEHVFPVIEDPSPMNRAHVEWVNRLVEPFSQNGKIPVHCQVERSQYGLVHTWTPLRIDSQFCLLDSGGKSILCIEADSTNFEDALGLGNEAIDLTPTDATLTFRAIVRAAQQQMRVETKVGDLRVLRVYLGDSLQRITTGGGHAITLREHMKYDADILIDSHATVLKPLIQWCQGVHFGYSVMPSQDNSQDADYADFNGASSTTNFEFHTDKTSYFRNLSSIVQQYNWRIVDIAWSHEPSELTASDFLGISSASSATHFHHQDTHHTTTTTTNTPLSTQQQRRQQQQKKVMIHGKIIYYSTSEKTVNATHALIRRVAVDDDMCDCFVIVDSMDAYNELLYLRNSAEKRFEVMCSAEVHDDILRQVRIWARLGYPYSEMQNEIDNRFGAVMAARQAAFQQMQHS